MRRDGGGPRVAEGSAADRPVANQRRQARDGRGRVVLLAALLLAPAIGGAPGFRLALALLLAGALLGLDLLRTELLPARTLLVAHLPLPLLIGKAGLAELISQRSHRSLVSPGHRRRPGGAPPPPGVMDHRTSDP